MFELLLHTGIVNMCAAAVGGWAAYVCRRNPVMMWANLVFAILNVAAVIPQVTTHYNRSGVFIG